MKPTNDGKVTKSDSVTDNNKNQNRLLTSRRSPGKLVVFCSAFCLALVASLGMYTSLPFFLRQRGPDHDWTRYVITAGVGHVVLAGVVVFFARRDPHRRIALLSGRVWAGMIVLTYGVGWFLGYFVGQA